jgi:hypothetical protein
VYNHNFDINYINTMSKGQILLKAEIWKDKSMVNSKEYNLVRQAILNRLNKFGYTLMPPDEGKYKIIKLG